MNLILAMAPQQNGGGSMVSTIIMFGAIFAIFYFMIIRPQQKRAKERTQMLNEIKAGDEVMTSGGLYGKISRLDEKTFILEVDDKVKLKFDRTAIANVVKK